jgi:hypothetical protein
MAQYGMGMAIALPNNSEIRKRHSGVYSAKFFENKTNAGGDYESAYSFWNV